MKSNENQYTSSRWTRGLTQPEIGIALRYRSNGAETISIVQHIFFA